MPKWVKIKLSVAKVKKIPIWVLHQNLVRYTFVENLIFEKMERYSRNRIYVSDEEQLRIKNFKIVLGGAGIGSIIAECLLRFGFETLTIVDGDIVEESNLNRQNYTYNDIGVSKVKALKKRLMEINPDANINTIESFIDHDNVEDIVKGHEIAINALDFKSDIPFVFDEWCRKYNIPVLHPYNIGWAGLVFVVTPTGIQLKDICDDDYRGFEVKMIKHIFNYYKFWGEPKPWIEQVVATYENENGLQSPPQLAVASWLIGGIATHLCYKIAVGEKFLRYPKFYLDTIKEDHQ